MNKGSVSIVGIIVAVIAGAASRAAVRSMLAPNMRSERVLSKVAAEMNRDLPMMVDSETQLVACSASEALFTYSYRVVHHGASEVDPSVFVDAVRPQITTGACTTKETRKILDAGVTLRYSYADKSDNAIADIDVSAASCR